VLNSRVVPESHATAPGVPLREQAYYHQRVSAHSVVRCGRRGACGNIMTTIEVFGLGSTD
jgi:hypothetical protein